MLVLSRHRDESIMIGDDVVVTIVDIRGDKVRLGIDAPQDIQCIARRCTRPSSAKTKKPRECNLPTHAGSEHLPRRVAKAQSRV